MNEKKNSAAGLTEAETPSSMPQPSELGVQEKAKQTAQTANAEIEKLKGAAREQGSAAVEEIKTAAQSAAREAQEAGRDFVHGQKENLAQRCINTRRRFERLQKDCAMRKATCSQNRLRRGRSNSSGCRATCARKSQLTFLRI
jgi:hypothetical protein